MPLFKRSRATSSHAEPDAGEVLRAGIVRVALLPDEDAPLPPAPPDARARLVRIVAEAVVLQDQAVEVLAHIRNREPLAEQAARGGPLARRFFELRRQLPPPSVDRELSRQCQTASVVLDHHGTVLTFALDLLAAVWRSQAVIDQLDRLDGLGPAAERLDALYLELTR
jgi:hypothetical protein